MFDPSIAFADNVDAQIFFVARLPRVLAAAFVGSALAAAGVVFQALLRNPLATPFTLGVSAGAALGAMLAITFSGALAAAQVVSVPVASFAGSMAAVAIVYALASARHRGFSTNVMLLAGVTMNSFFSAVILFVQYFADMSQATRALRWLMGDLDVAGYTPIVAALPLGAAAFAVFAWLPRALNLLGARTRPGRGARRRRVAGAAAGLLQRLARHRRRRVARRPRRIHRHRRAAPGTAAWWGRTIGSCCRPPRSSARRSSSRAISWRARSWLRSSSRWAS